MKNTLLALLLVLLMPLMLSATPFTDKLESALVHLDGRKVAASPAGALANKKVLAFYFSAHWCPPCRAFTPELSKDYKKLSKKYPGFELIFVSSDRSAEDMAEYMDWGKMEFPALAYDKKDSFPILRKLSAQGIPYLVVTDADGKELAGRGSSEWVHPSEIMPKLEEILKKGG
ncbi:MAG: thioredoxin-like domain-containing protein [Candidatus Methylacidiphilales bacterium]|nr:thioredoxin-like domain-containing protein [Candidatus Methylacidiphilales bacterium]